MWGSLNYETLYDRSGTIPLYGYEDSEYLYAQSDTYYPTWYTSFGYLSSASGQSPVLEMYDDDGVIDDLIDTWSINVSSITNLRAGSRTLIGTYGEASLTISQEVQ